MVLRIAFALVLLGCLLGSAAGREVTTKRDRWGVPHIFAESLADASYGLGYAQAEDRLEQVFTNYRRAVGRMAERHGAEWVERDWEQRLAGNEPVCRRRYPELPAELRACCEAYQDGVRAYLADHPETKPVDYLPLEPWMIPAVGRMVIFHWPLGQAQRELGRRAEVHLSSNQWAVRPERTADGAAFLLIDPHVPWDGPFRAHEFRIHAGGHDLSGFGIVGTPAVALGHNAFLAWAATTGGPDTTDIYAVRTDPANPLRYRYEDGWREMTREDVVIQVKDAAPVRRHLDRSHHGPVVLREGAVAYAMACPYLDQVDLATQQHRMMTARSLAEFDAAVALCQFRGRT